MSSLRLQTKFLLTMTLVTASLTATALLVVRRSVQHKVRQEIFRDLETSVLTFQNSQHHRQTAFSQSAELLADLPNLRALMTTRDASTIQDASQATWHLARSDLFILADPSARVMALYATTPGLSSDQAHDLLVQSLRPGEFRHWWYAHGQLYEVVVQPIYFGNPAEDRILGFLTLGYEVNSGIAEEISRESASQVAFVCDNKIVTTTLSPSQKSALLARMPPSTLGRSGEPDQVQLEEERFLGTSVDLNPGASPAVYLVVLKSLDQATLFLNNLNHELIALGLLAVLGGSFLVFVISKTFTRPLEGLVAGVRALERGNYEFPLKADGGDEVAEVALAFDRMRGSLQNTQRELLDSERLATIGRMASSISHDLRHSLAAIVANAEFLCESDLTSAQREDLYQEVRAAVDQMTDLIEALLEFSRTRESLRPSFGSLNLTLQRVIQRVQAHPEYHPIGIELACQGSSDGWFDAKRLERVFQNLLLNACEAVPHGHGRIEVKIRQTGVGVEVWIADNGPGIAPAVRNTLFDPFVSHDKENGTGLGLTVVQKIVQDHGGEVTVESTSSSGTVFKIALPVNLLPERALSADV